MKTLITLTFVAVTALGANAAPCNASTFSAEHGAAYLQAETALIEDDNAETALEITEALWASDLNCFERASVRKLRAASFIEISDYASAVDMLRPLLSDETEPAADRAKIAYNIGQLYLSIGEEAAATPYLELARKLRAE